MRLPLESVTAQPNCSCVGAELLMCRRLRTTLPLAQEQRVPKLPDPTVLSNKNDQVKWRQKKNFDADHGVKVLPTLHLGDTV